MKKFVSTLLAVVMLLTMPGFLQPSSNVEVKAADVVASADFTSGRFVGKNMEFVDGSDSNNESYTYTTSKGGGQQDILIIISMHILRRQIMQSHKVIIISLWR